MHSETLRCGLLGRTLGHSYSPAIHAQLADYAYSLYEKEPEELERFLRSGEFDGLNVTIPYKKTVIPYCAELSDTARAIGAVNTIGPQAGRNALGRQHGRLRLFHAGTVQRRGGARQKGARLRQRRRVGNGAVCPAADGRAGGRCHLAARGGQLRESRPGTRTRKSP